MAGALADVRVLEIAQNIAVPVAGRHLADFGADVIHVEPLSGDFSRTSQAGLGGISGQPSPINYSWENNNRNKRSLAVDLSSALGKQIVGRLVKSADVLLTNLRPYELQKFGLRYEDLSPVNPRLVHGSLNSYGKRGAERNAPGYDLTAWWARSSISHVMTWPDTVPPCFVSGFGDNVASLALAYGIALALLVRDRTGRGQDVDLSLFQSGVYTNAYTISGTLVTKKDYDSWRKNSRADATNPLVNPYRTKDGRWLQLSVANSTAYWPGFCRAIEREDLLSDPRFGSRDLRAKNHEALFTILEQVLLSRSLSEWQQRLGEAGMPFEPLRTPLEVVQDPQAKANEFYVSVEHPAWGSMDVLASPVNLGGTPATVRMPGPELGEHTAEVLSEAGYSPEDISVLRQSKAVRTSEP